MISSKQNNSFKHWVKLKTKKYRDQENQFLIFGQHLIDYAYKYEAVVELITSNPQKNGTLISKELMDQLNFTETSYDIMAVCKKINRNITSNRVLMLDDVQDPDNVGALIRSASAFGFNHIILSLKSADLYNEKVIRASKGAIFDVFVERMPLIESIKQFNENQYIVFCADAAGELYNQTPNRMVLILGNEGHGVQESLKLLSDRTISIPTQNVESLNVSVAGAILMYEMRSFK